MKLMTIDEISEMIQLGRAHTLNVIVKKPGFPLPVIGKSKPRWDYSAVTHYFKTAQKANTA
jgi:predicted DNA-binding transcriptional regulator AlpA